MISVMYLSVTMIISAQKMIDSMPSTFPGVSGRWCAPVKHCRSVYKGDVPMSPYTTPIAPMTSGASRFRGPLAMVDGMTGPDSASRGTVIATP